MKKVLVVYAIETTDCISALGQETKIPTTKIRNQIVTLENDILNEAVMLEITEYFEQELDKAERRGLEKALGFIIGEGNISWAKDKIVESIKLLEEENGKQNAR